MSVVVISPPSAVVTAADARTAGVFSSDDADALVDALLATAQATIDGPAGWLGRAVGLQTLELTHRPWAGAANWWFSEVRLPYLPIRSITSVKYTDGAGVEQTLSPSAYVLTNDLLTFASLPPVYALRIRYQAGYDAATDGLLPVPAPIRFAIMLMAAQLRDTTDEGIVREEVTGVGVTAYSASKTNEDLIQGTAKNLLALFREFA